MRHTYLYLLGGLLSMMVMVSCQHDLVGGLEVEGPASESESIVVLKGGRTDGTLHLSVDAPAADRFGVWIDLDGDGSRAEDGSEDVKRFNAYQKYSVADGVKEITIHGDINYLGAASNELDVVDISGNPYIETLNIPSNRLKSVDVTQNAALVRLDCSGNGLSTIDVSQNTALELLWVFDNRITAMDLSNNTKLTFLDCSTNDISSIDISANFQLERLLAYDNKITELDISKNTQLQTLWLFGNPLSNSAIQQLESSLRPVSVSELWLSDDGPLNHAVAAEASTQ